MLFQSLAGCLHHGLELFVLLIHSTSLWKRTSWLRHLVGLHRGNSLELRPLVILHLLQVVSARLLLIQLALRDLKLLTVPNLFAKRKSLQY